MSPERGILEYYDNRKELHPTLQKLLLSPERFGKYRFAPPVTRDFLTRVIIEGAQNIQPVNTSGDLWVRRRNFLGIYFSTGASLRQIGQIYGVTRELVRQDIKTTMSDFWLNTAPQTQQQFPLENIQLNKADSLPPEYTLLVKNGLGNKIVELLEAGEPVQEITDQLSPQSPTLVYKRLRLLRKLGLDINMQRSHTEIQQLITDLMDQTKTDEAVQQLLDAISFRIYHINRATENPFLTTVTGLGREAGFHVYRRNIIQFITTIREAQIPIRKLEKQIKNGPQADTPSHYLMVAWHQDRATTAFRQNPDLQKYLENPVQQISGPESKLPSTWQIQQRRGCLPLAGLMSEFGINGSNSKQKKEVERLLAEESPVPIFKLARYSTGYYFPADQKAALKQFIEAKLNT